jgi:hypothetical protein
LVNTHYIVVTISPRGTHFEKEIDLGWSLRADHL